MALQLIKFLLSYNTYTKYNNIIYSIFKDNKELLILYNYLSKMHDKYAKDISIEEFSLYVLTHCQEKDKDNLSELLTALAETDTDPSIVTDIINDLVLKQKAHDLAIAALEVTEGRKDFSDLQVLAENLNATESDSVAPEGMFVTNDLHELYDDAVNKQGLRWRLNTLNRIFGSLRKGDFGFIFARPETGKTTFLASEVTFMAEQVNSNMLEALANDDELPGPIIWINNEEEGKKVQLRLYQAMLGVTLTELFGDLDGNKKRYMERGGTQIKLWDNAAIHKRQIEQVVRELRPSLIVIDQIDKLKGFDGDQREDLRLGEIYIWAREIAKQYCPVIAVCQADASGEGKRWLTMDNVANAKTAKQAEADWILGIGKTHDVTEEFMRHLCANKNKLTGDTDTDPNLRHGRQSVRIAPTIARYEDL